MHVLDASCHYKYPSLTAYKITNPTRTPTPSSLVRKQDREYEAPPPLPRHLSCRQPRQRLLVLFLVAQSAAGCRVRSPGSRAVVCHKELPVLPQESKALAALRRSPPESASAARGNAMATILDKTYARVAHYNYIYTILQISRARPRERPVQRLSYTGPRP